MTRTRVSWSGSNLYSLQASAAPRQGPAQSPLPSWALRLSSCNGEEREGLTPLGHYWLLSRPVWAIRHLTILSAWARGLCPIVRNWFMALNMLCWSCSRCWGGHFIQNVYCLPNLWRAILGSFRRQQAMNEPARPIRGPQSYLWPIRGNRKLFECFTASYKVLIRSWIDLNNWITAWDLWWGFVLSQS